MFRKLYSRLFAGRPAPSVLAWPAWLRMLALLPFIALLWLLVAWANL